MTQCRCNVALAVCGALWLVAIATGASGLWVYGSTPGRPAAIAPAAWPSGTAIPRAGSARSTLVLFAHPRCPCTRASLRELGRLMARCRGRIEATVIVSGATPPDDALFAEAAATPGVRVVPDVDGGEARRFGAATSGQTFLYDAAGGLAFAGGITAARGHEGDNAGAQAVAARATDPGRPGNGGVPACSPVFGCPLRRSDNGRSTE